MGLPSVGRPTPASTCCARLDRDLWWVRARGDKAVRLGSIADREGILSLTSMDRPAPEVISLVTLAKDKGDLLVIHTTIPTNSGLGRLGKVPFRYQDTG